MAIEGGRQSSDVAGNTREPADEQEHRRAVLFRGARSLCMLGLIVLTVQIARAVVARGYPLKDVLPGAVWFPVLCLLWAIAGSCATWICRGLGLSLDGLQVETISRSGSLACDHRRRYALLADPPEPILVPRGYAGFIVPVCFTLIAVIGASDRLPLLMSERFWLLVQRYPGVTIPQLLAWVGCIMVAILSWRNVRQPEIRADDRGIATCHFFGLRVRSAPWEWVASCDIITSYNACGKAVSRYAILKDARGKRLLTLSPSRDATSRDGDITDRLIRLLRFKLTGHKTTDAWDMPLPE